MESIHRLQGMKSGQRKADEEAVGGKRNAAGSRDEGN